MKILQWYILREHILPFLFALVTITFLLVIEWIPKIVDQVIDKDLSIWVVLELIGVNLAWMLALAVPMSVLVATLMAFGRLTSDLEITAVKSSGINLLQVLTPLFIAATILAGIMFWFHDRILPDLNKRARTLAGDISAMHPTLVFRSGIFISDIPGYLIQVDKIDHTTSRVEGVRITETKVPSKPRIIVAQYGYLKTIDNGRNLEFTLYNGQLHSMDLTNPENYRKVDFGTQVINIAGNTSELQRTESDYRTDREMPIDTMQQYVRENTAEIRPLAEHNITSMRQRFTYLFSDTFTYNQGQVASDSAAYSIVRTDATVTARTIERNLQQIDTRNKVIDKYKIEIYKKYSIPAACIVFILIGAPLAILTKRGGMGISISISILLFVVYWAFLVGGEEMGDRGIISPFFAMWGANILLTVIGLYLMYIVVSERPVFAWFRRITE